MKLAFGIVNIARQAPEPAFAEAGPQQRANEHHYHSGNHEKFPNIIHYLMVYCHLDFNNCKGCCIDYSNLVKLEPQSGGYPLFFGTKYRIIGNAIGHPNP